MDVSSHLLEAKPSKVDILAYLAFHELSCARLATQLLQPFPTLVREQPARLTIGSAEWLEDAMATMIDLRNMLNESQRLSDAVREKTDEFLMQTRRVSSLVDELVDGVKILGSHASELRDWVAEVLPDET